MSFTLSSPQTVTKSAIKITGAQISFAGAASSASVRYQWTDQSNTPIAGSDGQMTIAGEAFVSLWNGGFTLSRLSTAVAQALGITAGTSSGDGTLQ